MFSAGHNLIVKLQEELQVSGLPKNSVEKRQLGDLEAESASRTLAPLKKKRREVGGGAKEVRDGKRWRERREKRKRADIPAP